MPKSIADRYLGHISGSIGLVSELKQAKSKAKQEGQEIVFHRFIREAYPNYRFYRLHAELVKQFQRVINGGCKRLIISTSPRHGKLCAHETPVLTPGGWTTHGELRPGDWVYHPSGRLIKVLRISSEDKAEYRVRISNGDEIWCHGAHEWEVYKNGWKDLPGEVLETKTIAKLLRKGIKIDLPEVKMTGREPSIESVHWIRGEKRHGRCIQVDSEDGLYLVGKNLTPTHNSLLSSRLLPAAYLLQHPERQVAICSYSAELAEGFSREAREFYRNAGGMLDPSNQSVNRWGTEGGGGCWATGIGGSVTGRSASLIIADDTVKGREEADSPRTMEKLWSFYQGSLYTRLEPKHGAIVVVATRWGENDLTGRLLEMEANAPEEARENWTIIDWPAISEDLGSRPPLPQHCEIIPDWREKPGEALCSQRYDTYDLERIRQAVGAREWSALYQQRPAPIGGNMFDPEWWQYYESDAELPVMDRIMLSVDCTFTSNSDSDYVVGTVVGQAGIRFYLIDMYRERTDINGTIAMILRMQGKYQINGTIIELAASGFAAYQLLHTRIPGVIGYKPNDRSKVARLSGIVPVVEAGNVYIPQHATWLDTFLNEFSLFPAAKNDDICDSMAQAINYMNQRTAPQITAVHWGRAAFLPGDLQRIEPW
jgi:predicted phage terminase large subunit-like protein